LIVQIGGEQLALAFYQRDEFKQALDQFPLSVQVQPPRLQYDGGRQFELRDSTVSLCVSRHESLRNALYNLLRAGCRLRTSSEDVNRSGRD